MFGRCPDGDWMVSDGWVDGILRESGRCPRVFRKVSVKGQVGTGQVNSRQVKMGQAKLCQVRSS